MKATIGKKVLPLFLSLLLLLGLMPVTVFAAGGTTTEGLVYEVNGESVTITEYTGSGGNVTIPAEIEGLPVTTIGDYAFYNCTSLTSIEIPASVTTIGKYAFWKCTNLRSVTFAEESKLTTIEDSAFRDCRSLTSIEIPAGVTVIGNSVFSGCSSLTSIEIPDSVTTIGDFAFDNCTNLRSVTFAKESKLTTIGNYAFFNCSLTSIEIPASVTTIRYGAFCYCTNLRSVTFAEESKLTTIEDYGFDNCTNLSSMTFTSKTAPSLGNNAFLDCFVLAAIHVPHGATGYTTENGWPENLVDAGSHTLNYYDAVAPTCTENGTREYWYCPGCKKYFSDESGKKMIADIEVYKVIPATGHDWGEPEWNWKDDYSSASATFTCGNDASHEEELTAKITSATTDATATADGKTVYTATVKLDGNSYKDTKTVVIPATGTTTPDTSTSDDQTGDKDNPGTGATDSPQTGDNSNIVLWISLMVVGAAGLGAALILQKRRRMKG